MEASDEELPGGPGRTVRVFDATGTRANPGGVSFSTTFPTSETFRFTIGTASSFAAADRCATFPTVVCCAASCRCAVFLDTTRLLAVEALHGIVLGVLVVLAMAVLDIFTKRANFNWQCMNGCLCSEDVEHLGFDEVPVGQSRTVQLQM